MKNSLRLVAIVFWLTNICFQAQRWHEHARIARACHHDQACVSQAYDY